MEVKMWGSEITRSQMFNTVTKLQSEQKLPHEPRENPIKLVPEVRRSLSLVEEQDIASKLAFLSATSPSNLEIMAVCFEEDPEGDGMTIRLASNTGVPAAVTHGFKILAKILMTASSREQPKQENVEMLFHHIVDMDFCRIVARLRSRHDQVKKPYGSISQPTLIDHLRSCLWETPLETDSGLSSTELSSLKETVEQLALLFRQLEALPDPKVGKEAALGLVERIVKQVYNISKSGSLNLFLRNSKLNPCTKDYILDTTGKLGTYYSVAIELVSVARKKLYRIFNTIRIEALEMPIPDNVTGRVHAEIQLLFFYESNPDLNRPRVICSSKSACYLCNLFFEIHGGFLMPRTHGRVYDKWILPDWIDVSEARKRKSKSCLTKMKAVLDTKIKNASVPTNRRLSDPKESVLLPSVYWPSSSAITNVSKVSHSSTSTIRPIPCSTKGPLENGYHGTPPLTPPESPTDLQYLNPPATSATHLLQVKTVESLVIKASPSSTSVCSIDISHDQLPYHQPIMNTTSSLHLNMEELCLSFEFVNLLSGKLLIEQTVLSDSFHNDNLVFNVKDISTTEDVMGPCQDDASTIMFHLQCNSTYLIRVQIELEHIAHSHSAKPDMTL